MIIYNSSLVILLTFVSLTFAQSICTTKGTCDDNGKCSCIILYEGDDCCTKWTTYDNWTTIFWIYVSYNLLLHLGLLFWALRNIHTSYLKYKESGKIWNISFQATLAITLSEILRLLFFTVDPHRIHEIFPVWFEAFLFFLPVLIYVDSGYLVVLYWVELQKISGIKELKTIKRYKPMYYGIILSSFIFLIPAGLWQAFSYSLIPRLLINLGLMIYIISVISLSTYHGTRLLRFVKGTIRPQEEFLKKVTIFILGTNICLGASVIILGIYSVIGRSAYGWLGFRFILQTLEAGAAGCLLLLLSRKRPKSVVNSNKDTSRDVSMVETKLDKSRNTELP